MTSASSSTLTLVAMGAADAAAGTDDDEGLPACSSGSHGRAGVVAASGAAGNVGAAALAVNGTTSSGPGCPAGSTVCTSA